MKRLEKMLLGALVGVLVLWQGGVLVYRFIFEPVAERQVEVEAREERVFAKKKQLKQSQAAARKLAEWNRRSLPPDPIVASSLYQNWLIELATRTKLTNVVVTPNRADAKPKGDTYFSISAIVKAQGTLDQLCKFLYEFRHSGLLHRVTRMSLATDEHQGNPPLEITLTVEGLALKNSPARTPPLAVPDLAEPSADRRAGDRTTYSGLLAKNPFVRGYNGPPRPATPDRRTTPTAAPPEEDPREFVYFVSRFSTGDVPDATFYDRSTNETSQLSEGSEFRIAGVEGKVVSIDVDFVTLKIKGDIWRMDLGDNLAQLKKVAPAVVNSGPSE